MKLQSCFILSNNGLGDNITMIGALRFLLNYYETIFFLCKDIYCEQIKFLYRLDLNINIVPFNSKDEFNHCSSLISNKNDLSDVFICGTHKSYLHSKITHPELLNYSKTDSLTLPDHFSFIKTFYHDMGLDLSIFVNYFKIDTTDEIAELYNNISMYKIIFIHSTSSVFNIDLSKVIDNYINDDNSIIICANNNYYDKSNHKFEIANKYIFLPTVFHYIEIIKNACDIYVTDSCISCMIIPLMSTNNLSTKNINIYNRETHQKIVF